MHVVILNWEKNISDFQIQQHTKHIYPFEAFQIFLALGKS